MNTLEFDSLYLEFGMHRVLSSVHIKCTTGRIVGLLGRNGSGKSCLMRVVLGTMRAESKSVRFNNKTLLGNYMKERIIAYLPQSDLLPPFITFASALKLYGIENKKMEDQFPEAADFIKRNPSEVSGGQKRFFEALLVIYSPSPFCILDEPFSGLMPLRVEHLMKIIQEEKKNKGFIITDHLHRSIRTIADDLYVLSNGKTYKILREEQLLELCYLNEL
jgi:ABC-type multidrug transport system ATPase subunit